MLHMGVSFGGYRKPNGQPHVCGFLGFLHFDTCIAMPSARRFPFEHTMVIEKASLVVQGGVLVARITVG